MGDYSFHIHEVTVYGHQIGPHPYSVEQTLRDQSDASRVAQIASNEKAQQNSLSKQRENYELAHQYMLEQSYHHMGERRYEFRQGQLVDLVV